MPTAATTNSDSDSSLISKQGTADLSTLTQAARGPVYGGHLMGKHLGMFRDQSEPLAFDPNESIEDSCDVISRGGRRAWLVCSVHIFRRQAKTARSRAAWAVAGRRSAAGLRVNSHPIRAPTPNVRVCAAAWVSCMVSTVTAPAPIAKVSATAKKNCFMMIPLSAGLHGPLQMGRSNRIKGSSRTARSSAVVHALPPKTRDG